MHSIAEAVEQTAWQQGYYLMTANGRKKILYVGATGCRPRILLKRAINRRPYAENNLQPVAQFRII